MRRAKPIGSDFVPYALLSTRPCGECGGRMHKGDTVLASLRNGKPQKIVCSENCRLEFDNYFWQEVARKRELGEKDRRP